MAEQFATERGLHLQVVNVEAEYGETIPQLAARTHRGQEKPCSVCGMTKRHIMNRVAREGGYDVLVTGHNLDDEAATLFGNTLNWLPGYLSRQWPVLEANRPGLARKAKPLCRMYERDMAAYALLRGIAYVYEECPHASGSNSIYYKEMLNRLEHDRPGAKMSFYVAFLDAKEKGLFTEQADPELQKLHSCETCGQPITAPGQGSFCRMVNKI
jgi:tRNA-5-methyluridine54 2-sulfurtransferase